MTALDPGLIVAALAGAVWGSLMVAASIAVVTWFDAITKDQP